MLNKEEMRKEAAALVLRRKRDGKRLKALKVLLADVEPVAVEKDAVLIDSEQPKNPHIGIIKPEVDPLAIPAAKLAEGQILIPFDDRSMDFLETDGMWNHVQPSLRQNLIKDDIIRLTDKSGLSLVVEGHTNFTVVSVAPDRQGVIVVPVVD